MDSTPDRTALRRRSARAFRPLRSRAAGYHGVAAAAPARRCVCVGHSHFTKLFCRKFVPAALRAADAFAEHVCAANIGNTQCVRLEITFGGTVETAQVRAVADLFPATAAAAAPAAVAAPAPGPTRKKTIDEEVTELKSRLASLPSRISVIEQAKQMGLKDEELYKWRCGGPKPTGPRPSRRLGSFCAREAHIKGGGFEPHG